MSKMVNDCDTAGSPEAHYPQDSNVYGASKCLKVYYEQLVLHPERVLREVLTFLNLGWNEAVLHHEDYVNKPGGISLSRYM